jgi:FixJ family two-component response regulator
MAEVGLEIPIVFLTGHGNIPASVQAMKAGAVEFLTKPVDEQDLLRAIQEAIERDRRTRQQQADMRHTLKGLSRENVLPHAISSLFSSGPKRADKEAAPLS